MIIIDQNTENKLSVALEKIKTHSEMTRCVYLNLKNIMPVTEALREQIIADARENIITSDAQIYICEDGDTFILAPTLRSKNAKSFMLDVAVRIGKPVTSEWARLVELPLDINTIVIEVEAKLEKRRAAEREKRQQAEQQLAQRKRETILHGSITGNRVDINTRRTERAQPELMIIEDDAFSRRLVENVLQKRYHLTGLGEATQALETYVRLAPDLLFLDIDLPDVTGHELLEKIVSIDPKAYVVMLSGNCDRTNITQAMSRGAKGFVAKPFTREKLFQYIENCPTIHRI